MKKISIFFMSLICILMVGCGNKPYTKEVNTYRINHSNVLKDITFEFVNDENYTVKTTNGSVRLTNELNKSKIELYFYYDFPANKTITKKKSDFTLESHNGFKKLKINEHEGWSVYQTNSLLTNYEINLMLTEPDEDGKVYAVDIKVIESPIKIEDNLFDTKEFVKSDDFKHLLNTLNVVDKEEIEENN